MIYLLIGQDQAAKEHEIATLKAETLPSPEALTFDYQVLHGYRLHLEELQKSLMALPVISSKRLVLLRQADLLTAEHVQTIREIHQRFTQTLIILLDCQEFDERHPLLKKEDGWKVLRFKAEKRHNVFDLMREVLAGHDAASLVLLDELMRCGDYPIQIMGGMLWAWRKARTRMSELQFSDGLEAFQQADWRIKRSQMRPEHALEALVTKLCHARV